MVFKFFSLTLQLCVIRLFYVISVIIISDHPHIAKCSECSADIRRGKPDSHPKDYQVHTKFTTTRLIHVTYDYN